MFDRMCNAFHSFQSDFRDHSRKSQERNIMPSGTPGEWSEAAQHLLGYSNIHWLSTLYVTHRQNSCAILLNIVTCCVLVSRTSKMNICGSPPSFPGRQRTSNEVMVLLLTVHPLTGSGRPGTGRVSEDRVHAGRCSAPVIHTWLAKLTQAWHVG